MRPRALALSAAGGPVYIAAMATSASLPEAIDCNAVMERFCELAEPALRRTGARACWVFGSFARGAADAHSDLDVIVVAPTGRSFFDRHRDYLDLILASPVPIQLLVYTPEEFARMREEERPFLEHALDGARLVYRRGEDQE